MPNNTEHAAAQVAGTIENLTMPKSQSHEPAPAAAPVTIYICSMSRCEHHYPDTVQIIRDGVQVGQTLICSKCGRTAFEEAAWL